MLGFATQIITNKQEMEERENCFNEREEFNCVPLTDEEQS